MPNQVLTIEPSNELKFKVDSSGLFEQSCTTYMRLSNPTSDTVLFKIKTTAPKKYYVRPNSGLLDPYSKVEIAITPQPVHVEPNERHKHKFMVQSVIAPEGKTNIEQVWKEISPDQLMDYKLRCVFEIPSGANDSGDTSVLNEGVKKRVAVTDDLKTQSPLSTHLSSTKAKSDVFNTDFIRLKEDCAKIRQENLQLREELLRLQQQGWAEDRQTRSHSYGPEKEDQQPVMPWIAIAFAMALLGIVIGKFIM
ncbi:vesicle-associated membrane protein-associated protein B-like isoform X2 [Leptidea sinapis]|uniref:vesicle-associated membrane protein-associated protein B-like isoform X2 n=1 Tax=Leptidea sinapis TaxID=189913 RepID=UPI002120C0E2|nr:vesicle-associated membrane protein-associated protein B-like isoform X2 [Leptidea sinapis]